MAMLVLVAVTTAIEVGSMIYRLLNRPKLRPPVGDLQISSSIQGAPIPFGDGRVVIAGSLNWTPGLRSTQAGVPGAGGSNFGGGATQFLFFADCDYSFCEGPAIVLRMWGDSKLIYDATPGTSEFPPGNFSAWNSATLYNIGDIVSYNSQTYTCTQQSKNIFPGQTADETGGVLYWQVLGSYAPWDIDQTYNPGDVVIQNGQLYVNIQTTSAPAHTVGNDHYWQPLTNYYGTPTFYPGTQTQNPDPLIQANQGVANTPAFRGLCHVVIENFRLANFGNRLPNVRAELLIGENTHLADVVLGHCKRAGLQTQEVDTSLLIAETVSPNDIVHGYAITRPTMAAEIIKTLFQAYFFDACESNGKLVFVPRGLPAAITIPESDLGLREDEAKVKPEQISQADDLPREVIVTFNDLAMDYQQGMQSKQRNARTIQTRQQQFIELPMSLDSSFARQVAEKTLWLAWLERTSYVVNLWRASYMLLDPTDVIEFVYEGVTFQMRAVETLIGQGFAVKLSGVSDNANNYLSSAVGGSGSGFVPQPVQTNAPTMLFLFDVPLLRDEDSNPSGTSYYVGLTSALKDWPGAAFFRSSDNANFDVVDTSAVAVSFGYTINALGAPRSPWTWDDENPLTVKMTLGTPIGTSDLNVLNGANGFLIGAPGRWEAVQSQSIVLNTDGTYTYSRHLRGRRGTEGNCGTHAAGDLVVVLPAGIKHETDALGIVNKLRYYKGVTSGQDVSGVASQEFTNTGNDLRPYAPTSIAAARDGSENVTLTWIRRTRIGGDWLNFNGTVPLSEDSEAYEVDIVNGSTVVRTLTGLTSPTASYSAADQITDFGSPQDAIDVRLFQISGEIGRGFAGKATV
jgi:hypothetical protein